jgi:hypothetical protein
VARRTSEARIGGLCTARAEGRRGGRIDPPASIARFPPRMLLLTHRKPGAAETTTNLLIGIWSRYVPDLKGQPTGQTLHQSSLLLVSCADRHWGYVLSPPETGQSPMYEDGRVLDSVTCRQKGVCKVPLPYTSSFRSTSKRDYAFRPPVCTNT